MKTKVSQESLSKAVAIVNKAVSTKPNLPILGNIYLEAKEDSLILASTDLEVGIRLKIKAENQEMGSLAVPSRLFSDFISSISAGEVSLFSESLILKVKNKGYSSSFNCLKGEDFPPFPETSGEVLLSLPIKDFSKALDLTVFATSSDQSRAILQGVLFEPIKEGLHLVATDGFRLSVSNIKLDHKFIEKLIIPVRSLGDLSKASLGTSKNEEENLITLSLSSNGSHALWRKGELEVVIRLLEGQFPDYKKIVPQQFITTLEIEREALLNAVKVASIFARDNANILHFSLHVSDKTVSVSASAREMGEGTSVLNGLVTGEDLEISFNAHFLVDILSALPSQEVVLSFSGDLKPMRLTAKGDDSFYHVLMPVRTGN